jgi:DNA-binding MarR family transcriptional regulator
VPTSQTTHLLVEDDLVDQVITDQTSVLQTLRGIRPLPEWAGLSLTVTQMTALNVLYQRGSASVGELGRTVGLSKARVSLLVNGLVTHGLVERRQDPADRRRAVLQLSSRAQTLLSEYVTGSRQQFASWLGRLDPSDLASLARGMRALADAANTEARHASARH